MRRNLWGWCSHHLGYCLQNERQKMNRLLISDMLPAYWEIRKELPSGGSPVSLSTRPPPTPATATRTP
jgi:hypothetical protein